MKNLAKLALFFSLSFAFIFLATTGIRFLSLQNEWAMSLPQKPETFLTLIIAAARWALSFTVHVTLLLSLSYAARGHYSAIMTVICVFVMAMFFCFGIFFALERWEFVPPAQSSGKTLGESGLILSNSLNRNETAVILLRGSQEPQGPRVVIVPDQPMLFQEGANQGFADQRFDAAGFELPPVPFGNDTPWFLKSLSIDIKLNSQQLHQRYMQGLLSFVIYAGALLFLMSSLGFAIKFSVWPLANLFLGILAFRGVLALETFFNSPEMQEIFDSFLKGMIPASLAVPVIFTGFGLLVHSYSILVYIAKRRDDDDY